MNTFLSSIQQSAFSMLAAVAAAPEVEGGDSYFVAAHFDRLYLWGALALVLLIVFALVLRARRRNRPLEVFSNETGRVQVAGSALADLIESAARQCGAASRPRVDFEHRGGLIHLHVRLKLASGQRLPEFAEELKKHLATTLRETFGLTNLGEIVLTVTGFKGSPLADPAEKLTVLPTPKPPSPDAPSTRPANDFFST